MITFSAKTQLILVFPLLVIFFLKLWNYFGYEFSFSKSLINNFKRILSYL